MTKRIVILVIALVLVLISTAACRANEDQIIAQSGQQANAGMSAEESGNKAGTGNKAGEPEMDQKQVERNVQKMKENGIVDQNGKPAPGVNLNDYPGLG